jgi:SsrA-binding protein
MKSVATNRKAFHDYEVMDKYEAGIELTGSEVKSIRAGKVNITEAFAQCHKGEMFINNLHINAYKQQGSFGVPDPFRKRKLFLHKREITHLSAEVDRKKLTLIPLSMYFKNQWIKVEIGLCRGRRKYDKRQKIAEQDSKRSLAHLMNLRRSV